MDEPLVRIAHLLHGCHTLGPGCRTVVWVRGCTRRCPGCIAAPILAEGPALELTPVALAARVLESRDEGVTFSGGEPFEQAEGVARAARMLREAGRSVMVYSGFTLEELQAGQVAWAEALLSQTDLLVDGPFEVTRQVDLLWRGSSNQRVHLLTPRHRDLVGTLDRPGAGVEVRTDPEGRLFWAGIPPAGFVHGLRRAAESRGIELSVHGGVWA